MWSARRRVRGANPRPKSSSYSTRRSRTFSTPTGASLAAGRSSVGLAVPSTRLGRLRARLSRPVQRAGGQYQQGLESASAVHARALERERGPGAAVGGVVGAGEVGVDAAVNRRVIDEELERDDREDRRE